MSRRLFCRHTFTMDKIASRCARPLYLSPPPARLLLPSPGKYGVRLLKHWRLILQFAIRPTTRNHNKLKRDQVIKIVADAVGPKHKVDLKNSDVVILVEIYQVRFFFFPPLFPILPSYESILLLDTPSSPIIGDFLSISLSCLFWAPADVNCNKGHLWNERRERLGGAQKVQPGTAAGR